MSSSGKRKPGAGGGDRPAKKSKGGNSGQWRTPAQDAKMARLGDRGAILEVGDQGIWVTFARGMERKAAGEFRRLCDELGQEMYGITPPKEAAAVEGDGGEEGEEGEEDIEASIKKELEGYKAPKSDAAREKWAFSIVPVVMDCVLFVKTRAPVQPVEFCRRICEDAKACTNLMERKTRYVNRLTPVTAMNKASEKGIDRAAREALAHWFTLNKATASTEGEDKSGEDKSNEDKGEDKSGDEVQTEASDAAKAAGTEKPAYTYAIRQSIRRNNDVQYADLIKQIASIPDARHKVNLTNPDKVILVDIFQNFCGVGVIDGSDWDGLRKMNVNEMYKLAAASDSKPTAQQEEKS